HLPAGRQHQRGHRRRAHRRAPRRAAAGPRRGRRAIGHGEQGMSRIAFETDTQPPAAEALPQYPPPSRRAGKPLTAIGLRVLSVLLIFALWELVSRAVTTNVVPTPAMTVKALQDALA